MEREGENGGEKEAGAHMDVSDHLAQKLFSQMGRLRPRARDWTQRALVGVSLDSDS